MSAIAKTLTLTLALTLTLTPTAQAKPGRDRSVTGDVIKAARYLATARLDEARELLADLEKHAADAPEVKWLRGELAFESGDYKGALDALDKVPDDAVDGMAGQTRKLAQQTLEVTQSFTETKSPAGHFIIRYAPGPDAAIAGARWRCARSRVANDRRRPRPFARRPDPGRDPRRTRRPRADVAADRGGDRDDGHDRAVEVQQADGGVAARDAVRLSVDGHTRPRVHAPDRLADLARRGAGVAAGGPRAIRADPLAAGRQRSRSTRPSKRCCRRACARAG